jgi:hypothetical protein
MRLEQIVAAAIRLGRGAGGDAIVAVKGPEAYVISYDRTVALHIRGVAPPQPDEVVFRACDYEGPLIKDSGTGHVVFTIEGGVVRVPKPVGWSFDGLASLFLRLTPEGKLPGVMLNRIVLSKIDETLPHVEFVWTEEGCRLIQRDIYTGKTLELAVKPVDSTGAEPLAMRTEDFAALFSMSKILLFSSASPVFLVSDHRAVRALVGGCLYDDVGVLKIIGSK